ncbi:hypothetical protein M404DRAFT_1003294 [Pisolithus tinctorius Marx 270]|uniref:Uncharacterized protein n=1 Tax=Pisolithus tinctorius Marx 270 TaxID=870435 RepID=A0A0C3P0Y1_PISTI|nr:hypothetical protein M404DRAFT_1003294 [Pisolithus tinctorius Marx 270]
MTGNGIAMMIGVMKDTVLLESEVIISRRKGNGISCLLPQLVGLSVGEGMGWIV